MFQLFNQDQMKSILFLSFVMVVAALTSSAQCPTPSSPTQSPQHGNSWFSLPLKQPLSFPLTLPNSNNDKENLPVAFGENNRCKCREDCIKVAYSYANSTAGDVPCPNPVNVCIARSQNVTEIKDPGAGNMCLGRTACMSSLLSIYGCQCHKSYCVGAVPPRPVGRPGNPIPHSPPPPLL